MYSMSSELEWIDFLDSQYTQFEKSHQEIKESPVNIIGNIYPNTKERKDLKEVDIDRIMIHESSPKQGQIKTTLRRTENDITQSTTKSTTNYKNNVNRRENTFRVGKLDVTKIEQCSKESENVKEDIQKHIKENKV